VDEEAGVGAEVVLVNRVTCTDADSGVNGDLYFSIIGSSSFQIHPSSGAVTATENLNFEESPSYTLTVACLDRGTPPMSSTAMLFVTVTDINEFTPRFTNESGYVFAVLESSRVGDVVGTVEAIDEDAGEAGVVSYSFINASADVPFLLDSTSGTISLSRLLDFETQEHQYLLQVEARDNPGNRNEATVIVNLRNVDDNLPDFPWVCISFVSERMQRSTRPLAV
jgi:hypothetical protein